MSLKFSSLYGGSSYGSSLYGSSNMDLESDNNYSYSEIELNNTIKLLLQFRTHIKMFHWQTTQFSYHKISDELLSSIDELTDKFVETGLGLLNIRPNIINNSISLTNVTREILLEQINQVVNILRQSTKLMENTEIATIRDEILIVIAKAKYLMSFN